MIWQQTPIFILNYQNLSRGFTQLLDWLSAAQMTNVTVIDNASTYPSLLAYYDARPGLNLLRNSRNLGHEAFWKLGLERVQSGRFILTDPDVVPDPACPFDLVRKMHEVADRYEGGAKVGPGIRIDNLPLHYAKRDLMLRSECRYWDETARTDQGDSFVAAIDTTFALYEPGWGRWPAAPHIRLDFPYVVNHIPWLDDSSAANEERDYYTATVIPGISHS